MRRSSPLPAHRRTFLLVATAVLGLALISGAGCKARNEATTETNSLPDATGTVQATLPVDATATATPTVAPTSTAAVTASPAPKVPAKPKPAPATLWPAKVAAFAKGFKGPVWYPTAVPKALKLDSLDVVEFDPGSGLVCDIVYTDGSKTVQFTQGSPTTRDYEIVSTGKVPWGTETADVVHEDPADTTTPIVIVYSKGGNFAELSGDVSEAELKAIAASMVPVK